MRAAHWILAAACTGLLVPACEGHGSDLAGQSPSPPSVESCGTVRTLGPNAPIDASALTAENCFWAAYTACRAATLTLETHGVDVVSTTTFAIENASPCRVKGTTDTVFVPSRRTTTSFTCARVAQKDGGLLFTACGTGGDIFVPPPAP